MKLYGDNPTEERRLYGFKVKKFVRVEFILRDLWVGVYWHRQIDRFDVYVCLLPCFPIHFGWFYYLP